MLNEVLGSSMKQICLSLSDVAASLRRAPLVDALGWKPLSSISPLTASTWVLSRGAAYRIVTVSFFLCPCNPSIHIVPKKSYEFEVVLLKHGTGTRYTQRNWYRVLFYRNTILFWSPNEKETHKYASL